MHQEATASVDVSEPAVGDAHDRWPDPRTSEIRRLRVEVAVLEERLTSAERVVAEREQRIRDLRGSLRVIHAGLVEAQAARVADQAHPLPAATQSSVRIGSEPVAGGSPGRSASDVASRSFDVQNLEATNGLQQSEQAANAWAARLSGGSEGSNGHGNGGGEGRTRMERRADRSWMARIREDARERRGRGNGRD